MKGVSWGMKIARTKVFRWIVILALVALALQVSAAKKDDELFRRFEELARVVDKIESNYVEEVDRHKLFEGAIEGMLRKLDPYSSYIPEDTYRLFREETQGRFGGLGIVISIPQSGRSAGWITVMSVLEGTPADEAGIRKDDVIGEIDGKSTRNFSLIEAVGILRGEVGTEVALTLYRRGSDELKVTLTRAVIKIESVKGMKRDKETNGWSYFVDEKDKIAYVRVAAFQEDTARDLERTLRDLLGEGMKALVLDLRFNHGGLYPSAIAVTDLFLSEGDIVSTRGRAQLGETRSARKKGTLPDFPLAVLVNDASASASEIVAGAIQDHKRGRLVGTRTFGKGSVQNIIPIEGSEAALKLTTQRWYTPSGRCVSGDDAGPGGLAPDIEVSFADEEVIELREQWRKEAYGLLKEPLEDEPDTDLQKEPFVDRQLSRAVTYLEDVLMDRELPTAGS